MRTLLSIYPSRDQENELRNEIQQNKKESKEKETWGTKINGNKLEVQ